MTSPLPSPMGDPNFENVFHTDHLKPIDAPLQSVHQPRTPFRWLAARLDAYLTHRASAKALNRVMAFVNGESESL